MNTDVTEEEKNNYDCILPSIKKICGINDEDTSFDKDILVAINSSMITLCQLGIGPKIPQMVKDSTETFSNFFGDDPRIPVIEQYLGVKTRLIFDPPSSSYVLDAMQAISRELEYRLLISEEEPLSSEWKNGDERSK